jgi:hypothetical protein
LKSLSRINISRVRLVLALTALLCGCSGSHPGSAPTPLSGSMANAAIPLVTPTFDGSGQGMHPGVIEFAAPWHGYKYWMSITPYPGNDFHVEDPSVLASTDGLSWQPPLGLINPLATSAGVHTMDPDLFYDSASDQIWLYYLDAALDGIHLWRRTSADGVTWSAGQHMLRLPTYQIISPAVEKTSTGYALWTVNTGTLGCSAPQTTVELRTSTDGVSWSAPQTVNLIQPGYQVWHMDVTFVPSKNEYWAVYAAYAQRSCGTTSLFLARSSDGINWTTYANPLLNAGTTWDAGQIYRSTIIYEASTDTLRLWYSARDGNHVWHTGYSEAPYATLLQFLSH